MQEKYDPFKDYEKAYATRHKIPTHWIRQNERLMLACFLEWQVATHVLSLPDARRMYCNEYPDANRLAVGKTVINPSRGTVVQDHNYALGSVLQMIQPYDDSIREVKNII